MLLRCESLEPRTSQMGHVWTAPSGHSSEYRRLQPQLFDSAACVQTAVLTHSYEPTRVAAMATFAKNWRRE
jgi:hypothetical protein